MRTLYTILIVLSIGCVSKKKEELKQINTQQMSPFVENECPDSSITFDEYKNYSSEDLVIDRNVLNLFDTSNHKFSKTLNIAIRIENSRRNKVVFELFKRQKDSANVLVPLKKAKLVKGEAPYSEEYYIYKSDTLFANSANPIYYYYDVIFNDRLEIPTFRNSTNSTNRSSKRWVNKYILQIEFLV